MSTGSGARSKEKWMLTVTSIFLIGAIVAAIVAAIGKCPLWVAVILLCVVEALQVFPR